MQLLFLAIFGKPDLPLLRKLLIFCFIDVISDRCSLSDSYPPKAQLNPKEFANHPVWLTALVCGKRKHCKLDCENRITDSVRMRPIHSVAS